MEMQRDRLNKQIDAPTMPYCARMRLCVIAAVTDNPGLHLQKEPVSGRGLAAAALERRFNNVGAEQLVSLRTGPSWAM